MTVRRGKGNWLDWEEKKKRKKDLAGKKPLPCKLVKRKK